MDSFLTFAIPRTSKPRSRSVCTTGASFTISGLVPSGTTPDGSLVEICEVRDHPWMVGSQFHPEFRSRPNRPHPLFAGFLAATVERSLARNGQAPVEPRARHAAAASSRASRARS